MNYLLFEEYITLQALLKDTGIIQSGGAIKRFLAEEVVLVDNLEETRRGKKLRVGNHVTIPSRDLTIYLLAPTEEELEAYLEEKKEKERVAAFVKEMNQSVKKQTASPKTPAKKQKPKKAPRFPGM